MIPENGANPAPIIAPGSNIKAAESGIRVVNQLHIVWQEETHRKGTQLEREESDDMTCQFTIFQNGEVDDGLVQCCRTPNQNDKT